ncbi:uncharacterized protein LY89DRAFT_787980 [Mollisia scopiformis]|uniref:Uncharacterized protein n=1 Tax=Mollisia scopiformis TaxID=149040 RepID=A0A132BDH2_MOLSC|nr:uncharacterized protein LY89DRAFT_787980 [Mollisia scopiformis]KUJ09707.1 hypothetical protein LY89DRAFT_787980 [Mollisia scopiformis]
MRFTLLPLVTILGIASSSPLGPEMSAKRDFVYEQLTFTFYGGPASYELSFPADGSTYPTNNALSVSLIDPGTFSALWGCNFYYDLPAGTAENPVLTSIGNGNEIAVGPPATISYVACEPTASNGTCLPVYAQCE